MSEPLPAPPGRTKLALLGIMALGLTLRLWTIGNGVPHTVGVDEPEILGRAVTMMKSGDFNPHFFDYGGLTIYFHLAVASLRFAVGALSATPGYSSLDHVWLGSFLLWARMATALIGALTIYVIYRVGLRWSVRAGLIAALLTALHPNLVRESHFALTDTPLAFFIALTLLVSLIASEDGRLRWFLLAGVTAGLAAAVKYNGIVALAMPLAVAVTSPAIKYRTGTVLTAGAAAFLAFLAAAPYSLLDLPGFLGGFAHLASAYNRPRPAMQVADEYLKRLRDGFGPGRAGWNLIGWPALLMCLAGLLVLAAQLRSRVRRAAALPVLAFTVAYFWTISNQSLSYTRYTLPLVPLLCLAFGVALTGIRESVATFSTVRTSRQLVAGLLVLLTLPPLWNAIALDWQRRKVTTEEKMAIWLRRNVDANDVVLIETAAIAHPQPFHWDYVSRAINEPLEAYRAKGVKYLVVSSERVDAAQYQPLFAATQTIQVIASSTETPGPTLTVLKVPPK